MRKERLVRTAPIHSDCVPMSLHCLAFAYFQSVESARHQKTASLRQDLWSASAASTLKKNVMNTARVKQNANKKGTDLRSCNMNLNRRTTSCFGLRNLP
jgi:hypothetical protein